MRKERIEEKFNIFDFQLSDEDVRAIETLDQKVSTFFDHRNPANIKWLASRNSICNSYRKNTIPLIH